ncbi:DUF4870 domain-containing protein [Nocardioides cavernaquae]|uniref:DUF4870 domain-containing protein n=1 Tax=Nocardioides cavernaquae TaxID=2321396 RepID=A0A3A5HD70_9ACTN|nr:DUF4870 domain-containing protein [Nocardioides cavernaquae]RJS45954.1 DUF4870 domain-containing protein [Nocardioides cavernaquae]
MSENPYAVHPNPNAPLTPEQERTWAVGTHVITGAATVLSVGTLGFVAALVVYLMYKDRGPFVRRAAANSMNIQLNGLLWYVGVVIVGVLTLGIGFVLWPVVAVVMVALHVIAAVKNSQGQWYDPPFTIRFVS